MRTFFVFLVFLFNYPLVGRKLLSERDENKKGVLLALVSREILSEGNYSLKEMRTYKKRSVLLAPLTEVGRKLLSERDENKKGVLLALVSREIRRKETTL